MATLEEILQKAKNADAAGDTDAARRLVALAKGMAGGTSPAPVADKAEPPPVRGKPAEFGDVTRDMTEGPIATAKQYGGALIGNNPSPSIAAIDANPYTQRLPGFVKGAAGLAGDVVGGGLALAHTALAGGAGLIGDAVNTVSSDPRSGQRLANDVMGMVESSAGIAAPATFAETAALRGVSGALKADRIANSGKAAARDIGVTPSLGMSGKTGAMIAAGLEKVPGVGAVIQKDATRAVSEIEGAYRKATSGAVSPASAGEVLQGGLKAFIEKGKAAANIKYDEVARHLPPDTKVRLPNAATAIAETKKYFADNPELAKTLGLNSWDKIITEAAENGIPWQGLRQLRSKIGEGIGSIKGPLSGESDSRLKMLYGALSKDMEVAAKTAGGKAYDAWKTADSYYSGLSKRVERSLDATVNAKSPERAFEAFDALTKADRSSSDIYRVQQIKASMKPGDWNAVATSIAERMGKAKSGAQNASGDVFSPSSFLTEWNKLDPQARRILFKDDVRTELEKIAKVAEMVKSGNLERNASNTGTITASTALMAGLWNAPAATATAYGGLYVSAKAMTSPLFLRAINGAARGDAKAMEAMAKGRGPFADDARALLQMTAAETQGQSSANTTNPPRAAINK